MEPDEEERYLLAILDSADGIDLAEFSLHDTRNDDGCYRLYDYQYNWFNCDDMYQIDQGGRNLGKALALDTPIPTPNGWTAMGDLNVGDQLFDETGAPCWVNGAFEVMNDRPCFEIIFDDGSSIVADADHSWLTWTKADRVARVRRSPEFRAARQAARRADSPVGQRRDAGIARDLALYEGRRLLPAAASKRTTRQIAATVRAGKESNHSINLADPLRMPDADLPIPPYTLGAWLGDGSSRLAAITIGDADAAEMRAKLADDGIWSRPYAQDLLYRLDFPNVVNRMKDGLQATLRRLGVLGDKHIPTAYLRASEEQRHALLRGLFDTDGYINDDLNACEISSSNSRLAAGIVELLRSLGEKPHLKEGRAVLNGRDVGIRYRITWTARRQPASLARKVARFRPERDGARLRERRIVDVRPVASVPVRCIEVGSRSHLYLAGHAMVPTHNTERIKLRSIAFPFCHPGKSMLVTAPELNHLRPLTDEIEKMLLNTRLVRELMPTGKGAGIARQPHWQVRFRNGASIVSRLPNKDGKGVKGQHVVDLEIDECQDYPPQGWSEVVETLNAGDPDAIWCCHGVSRGVRDSFFQKTQPNSGWVVHRPMAMNRPSWGPEERNAKIVEYGGSRQAVDYRRNIYGEHGDAAASVFVLAKLMACVDLDEGSTYNSDVYNCIKIEMERFPNAEKTPDDERAALLYGWIDVPGEHFHGYNQRVGNTQVGSPHGYSAYWGGMDVGVTNHPSEILIFGQRTGTDFLELLTRVQMHRINVDDQMLVVQRLFELYGDRLRLGVDRTGVGFGVWDPLTRKSFGNRVYGFGFSEKRVAGFEDRPLEAGETQRDLARMRNVVEASTDWLRNDYVDSKRLRLPYDREILVEFQGQTVTTVRDNGDPYGVRRQYSGGSFHTLDAAKVAVATKHIPPLEAMLDARPTQAPVLDIFMGA